MTIKIKATRAYYDPTEDDVHIALKGGTHRIVRESDWRKLMKLVKYTDSWVFGDGTGKDWEGMEER